MISFNASPYSVFFSLSVLNEAFEFCHNSFVARGIVITRSSADADNGLDAFVGQSRSTNISGPFQVK